MPPPLDWDASSYEQTSTPQQDWGAEVLERLELVGDETVLDAGCGAGIVTAALRDRLPRGRVIGVDASPAMIAAARARLGDDVELHVCDLHALALAEPVDALLSTATLHWVPDHARLWRHLHALLRPGARVAVQFGGHGNVAAPERAMAALARQPPFAAHLAPFTSPWTFDTAETAAAELAAAGFADVDTWLARREARPADVRRFLGTSVAPGELARLPAELREPYLDALFAELGRPGHLDYVRCNVAARA